MELNLKKIIKQILSENEDYWTDVDQRFKEKFSKTRKEPRHHFYDVVGFDSRNEFAVLKGLNGKLYAFYYAPMNKDMFKDYVEFMEYGTNPDIDAKAVENYVNDVAETISKGYGLQAWESGEGDIVEIDPDLREKLLDDFASSNSIVKSLS